MNNKKRYLSLFLAVLMIFSSMPINVFAMEDELIHMDEGTIEEILLDLEVSEDTNKSEDDGKEYINEEEINNAYEEVLDLEDSREEINIEMSSIKNTNNKSRYTVLVLDTSGSMSGVPMSTAKESAKKFVEQVLKADGDNYVALVDYSNSANIRCEFTDNENKLKVVIDNLYASGGTNQNAGLLKAEELLDHIEDNNITKNILLLSDGLPQSGAILEDGNYKPEDYSQYKYANQVYETAKELKDKYSIYTLGFFHSLKNKELAFGRRLMDDIQNSGYYDVIDVNDLDFAFDDIANDIVKKSGTFKYTTASKDKDVKDKNKYIDYENTYYYDDGYFKKDSTIYNSSLATMSLCFAMASGASNEKDYINKSDNARNLLEETGFERITANEDFMQAPDVDSIGVVIGNKEIKNKDKSYRLLAVGIRGFGYEKEWASNATMGRENEHHGFKNASEKVLQFIGEYIKENKINGDIKLWITGFSRAGGTTNLTAGAINNGYKFSDCNLEKKDLYAYTFEAPLGMVKSENNRNKDNDKDNDKHNNIFNVKNEHDLVPKVAPKAFGFNSYGIDRILPIAESSPNYSQSVNDMKKIYESLDSIKNSKQTNYIIDDFAMFGINLKELIKKDGDMGVALDKNNRKSQGAFLNQFINKFALKEIKSRDYYVDNLEEGIKEGIKIWVNNQTKNSRNKNYSYSNYSNIGEETWNKIADVIAEGLIDNIGALLMGGDMVQYKLHNYIKRMVLKELNQANLIEYDLAAIDKLVDIILKSIVSFALKHPILISTMAKNIKSIGPSHYPELCLAWLQSMDKNYTTNAKEEFSPGSYRIIRINCPVDIQVYDGNNKLVAQIENDTPIDLGNSIISSINEDGEKIVYLPSIEEYKIKITGRDTGLMSYSINEYSIELMENTRIINYYDIKIEEGTSLTSKIPSFKEYEYDSIIENGSDTEYILVDDLTENILDPANEIKGKEVKDVYYQIELEQNDELAGLVIGSGERLLGNYAQIEAMAYDGYSFNGWYIDDKLISDELEYRFRVESDMNIMAKFTEDKDNNNNDIKEEDIDENNGDNIIIPNMSWKDLETKIVKSSPGDSIYMNMLYETIIPSYILNSMRNKDIDLVLEMPDSIWKINGMDIKDMELDKNGYDIKLKYNKDSIELAHKTDYPFKAKVNLDIDKNYANNSIYINYYNKEKNRIEIVDRINVKDKANIELVIDKGSNYSLSRFIEKGSFIQDSPDKAILLNNIDKKNIKDINFNSYIPYIIEEEIPSIIGFSSLYNNIISLYAPKDGIYEFRNNEKEFSDIKGHWAEDTIKFITSREIFKGVSKYKFNPDGDMTRAMFITALSRLDGVNLENYNISRFKDVSMDNWYGKSIAWGVEKGIVKGYNDLFKPEDNITREEMAVILSNYIEYKNLELERVSKPKFADDKDISSWSKDEVNKIKDYGLISGKGNNNFEPKSNADRGSVAQIFKNLIDKSIISK